MDSMLREGLCVVGVLYLLVHLCRSIGSMRQGLRILSEPATRLGLNQIQPALDPEEHSAVDAGPTSTEGLDSRLLDQF